MKDSHTPFGYRHEPLVLDGDPERADEFDFVWTHIGFTDDTPEMTQRRLRQVNLLGPAGFVSADDGEVIEFSQDGFNLEAAVGRARVGHCGPVWVGETTQQACCLQGGATPPGAPAVAQSARSAVTQKVSLRVGTKVSVHAAFQAKMSGQLRFLGSSSGAKNAPPWWNGAARQWHWRAANRARDDQKPDLRHVRLLEESDGPVNPLQPMGATALQSLLLHHATDHGPCCMRHVVSPACGTAAGAGTSVDPVRAEAHCAVFRTKPGSVSRVYNVGRDIDAFVHTEAGLKLQERRCVYGREMVLNVLIYLAHLPDLSGCARAAGRAL